MPNTSYDLYKRTTISRLVYEKHQLNRALVSATITAAALGLVAIVETYMLLSR